MASMSLDNEIKKYLPLLSADEKRSILSVIKCFLALKEAPKEPQRLTIEQYNKELDAAEAHMDAGVFADHGDVVKESESW